MGKNTRGLYENTSEKEKRAAYLQNGTKNPSDNQSRDGAFSDHWLTRQKYAEAVAEKERRYGGKIAECLIHALPGSINKEKAMKCAMEADNIRNRPLTDFMKP